MVGRGGGGVKYPPPLYKLRQSPKLIRSLRLLYTSSIRQLLGAADAQTAHHATFSAAPTHQLLGSTNAKTTPARAPAAAADRKQQPDTTCKGENG